MARSAAKFVGPSGDPGPVEHAVSGVHDAALRLGRPAVSPPQRHLAPLAAVSLDLPGLTAVVEWGALEGMEHWTVPLRPLNLHCYNSGTSTLLSCCHC